MCIRDRGFFEPAVGRIHLLVGEPGESTLAFEQSKLIHEGVHQLQYWYRRQARGWQRPAPRQGWFEEGLAEYLSGVERRPNDEIVFTGFNHTRVAGMQQLAKALKTRGAEYPLFPLETLVSFGGYAEVMRWMQEHGRLPGGIGVGAFFEQAWALTHFLREAEDGRYADAHRKLIEQSMTLTPPAEPFAAFRRTLGLDTDEDVADFEERFHAYVRKRLMRLDPRGPQFND